MTLGPLIVFAAALSSFVADNGVEVRAIPLRTELVVGEPLVLCLQVQNVSDRHIELNRQRAMSAVILVREAGQAEFEQVARGQHYREGFEVDGTDAWPPKMQWAWDEWIVRRTDSEGNPQGLVFARPGQYEVKVSVRLDHSAVRSRGWRDTKVMAVTIAERRDAEGVVLPPPDAKLQRILERRIQAAHWREEVAALEAVPGELADYAQFRIGELFYFTATGWRNLEPRWHEEFESAESAAQRSVAAFTKLSDRCPGLNRREADEERP